MTSPAQSHAAHMGKRHSSRPGLSKPQVLVTTLSRPGESSGPSEFPLSVRIFFCSILDFFLLFFFSSPIFHICKCVCSHFK